MTPVVLALTLAAGAPAPKDKAAPLEVTGEWVVEAYLLGGKEAPPGVHIRFEKDGSVVFFGGPPDTVHRGTYTLDRTTTPARIDVRFQSSPAEPMSGIIKADGDRLSLCFGSAGGLPEKFESPAGTGIGLLTLKRSAITD